MKKVVFQSYALVGNPGYKDIFEYSLRSWSEWCKKWNILHYVRSEVYNYGDTQFINQHRYEPGSSVEYDIGLIVDGFTLIHPMLHPDMVFSEVPYINLTECNRQFISVIAGTPDELNKLQYVDRKLHGSRSLFDRDDAILEINPINSVRANAVDMCTGDEPYIVPAMKALLLQPSIVRFNNNLYDKLSNIYWSQCCTLVDKGVY